MKEKSTPLILIVDDDPKLRKTLSDILRVKGYGTVAVDTGKAALDRVRGEMPTVALIDLKLEDMSGLELMAEIKKGCPGTECIMITGYASQASAVEAVNLGAYGYVQKPYDMEQLLVTIRRAIEKHDAVQALRESEARYRAIFEQAADSIVLVDPTTGGLVEFNVRAHESLGYSREEFANLTLSGLETIESAEEIAEHMEKTLSEGSDLFETKHRTKTGEIRDILVSSTVVSVGGRDLIHSMWSDITDRVRAEMALQQRNLQLVQLNRAGQTLSSTLELGRLPVVLLDEMRRLLNTSACSVWLIDRKTGELVCQSSSGPEGETVDGWRLAPGMGIVGCAAQSGETLVVADTRADKRHFKGVDQKTGVEMRSVLCVPLRAKGQVAGVIEAVDTRVNRFSSADLALAESLASAGALAIENARLYDETDRLRAFHEDIVQGMLGGILLEDTGGHVTFINPAGAELLGYTPAELVGLPWKRLVAPEYAEIVAQELMKRPLGIGSQYETTMMAKDGRHIPVIVNAQAVFEGEEFTGVLTAFTDISERVRGEQLMRALNNADLAMARALTPQEIFTAATEELKKLGYASAVFLTDESQSRLILHHVNYDARLIRIVEQLVGIKAENFSVPIETVDAYRKVLQEGEAVLVEDVGDLVQQLLPGPVKKLAGQAMKRLKLSQVVIAPLVIQGKVIGVLNVHFDTLSQEDIPALIAFANQVAAAWHKARLMQDLRESLDELKQTQAQLLHAQKMDALGVLAGGVAHDFNNLLTTILGNTQMALRGVDETDPLHKDLTTVQRNAVRAASLTRQLLLFSRRQPMEFAPVHINAIVDGFLKMLGRLIGEDIQIHTDLESEPWTIHADEGTIEQVIMNLAVNARDAMPEGGELTIKTENMRLGEEDCTMMSEARPGEFVCLSVADTGIGMDEETLQRIFEPFFTTKGLGKGTGLGLSVVYGIVQQHEGWVRVSSRPGQGSIFKVYLPAIPKRPETGGNRVATESEKHQGRGERVLLVEDDEDLRRLAVRVLGKGGFVVTEAASVQEALDIFETEQGEFQLVFSDVVLSDGSGPELVDQLLARKPELRVLLTSGYSDDKSQWSDIRAKGYPYMQKPYQPDDLLNTMREVIAGGESQS